MPFENSILTTVDTALLEAASNLSVTKPADFRKLANRISGESGLSGTPPLIVFSERYRVLVAEGTLEEDPRILRLLRKRAIRSLSGISVVSLLTPEFPCPGKCVYCPENPGLPKSYVPGEPAVMRAELNAFDPVRQIWNRLRALSMTGHRPEKCDVRIIGGSFSSYSKEFRRDFVRKSYDAHTLFSEILFAAARMESASKHFVFELPQDLPADWSTTLEEAMIRNSRSKNRVTGLAVETRPDLIGSEEIAFLRELGVTRVEIGYQTTVDEINFATGRGHGNAEAIAATKLLKDAGFKVVAHMMPNLPGSTPDIDRTSFARIFTDSDFRPDEVKIYPTMVVGNSALERIWKAGKFEPYKDDVLVELMADLETMIPEYVRLNRAYRDIPASEILAGSKMANLRQVTERVMADRGHARKDVSAREIRDRKNDFGHAVFETLEYEASDGREVFFQWVDPVDRTLFSLLRLRIPSSAFDGSSAVLPDLKDSAIIREIHTF
jgi:elongator complex protein 3